MKNISDVLEYLYQNKQKDLAEIVLRELNKPTQIYYTNPPIPQTPPTQPFKKYYVGDQLPNPFQITN